MLSDFKFAFRTLIKTPGFTAAAVTVLALGIGANTAVFSLVNALLFAPPSYAQPAGIVQVYSQDTKNPKSFRAFSYPTFQDIRGKNSVFTDAMAFNLAMVGIGEKDNTRRVFATLASSNYFSVLGVQPARGRGFLPAEETPGRGSPVVIVSHNFWKKHGSDPAYEGSKLNVNGRPYTVGGVMPEGFTGTMNLFSCEVWLPLGVFDQVSNLFDENKHQRPQRPREFAAAGRGPAEARPHSRFRRARDEDAGRQPRTGVPGRAEEPDVSPAQSLPVRHE